MTEGINRILDNPSVNALRVATSLYTREAYYPTKEHTMERVKGFFQHISLYIIALAKWLCIGGGVGLIGGVVGAAFHIGVEQATELRLAQPWIIWLLPVGGVVIVGLYRLAHMEGRGTNNIIESVHFGKDVPILLVPSYSSPPASPICWAARRAVRARPCRSAAASATVPAGRCIWAKKTCRWPRCAA